MNKRALAFLLTGLMAMPALAVDGYFVEAGGGDDLRAVRVGMVRQWQRQWLDEGRWHLTGYWEASLAQVESDQPAGKSAVDIGFTPVFRFRPNASGGTQPYWDVAVGLHVLSREKLDSKHDLGGTVQIAPLVGVGVTFGEKSQYDLGYRFQHQTRLDDDQDTLDLHQVRLTYLY